jgi:hypothetical protein
LSRAFISAASSFRRLAFGDHEDRYATRNKKAASRERGGPFDF